MVFDPRSENTHVIVGAGFLLKHYAKRAIEDFNEACLLKIQGEKYKKEYYSKEDIILQEWLERKRISCIHEEKLSPVFMREKF